MRNNKAYQLMFVGFDNIDIQYFCLKVQNTKKIVFSTHSLLFLMFAKIHFHDFP